MAVSGRHRQRAVRRRLTGRRRPPPCLMPMFALSAYPATDPDRYRPARHDRPDRHRREVQPGQGRPRRRRLAPRDGARGRGPSARRGARRNGSDPPPTATARVSSSARRCWQCRYCSEVMQVMFSAHDPRPSAMPLPVERAAPRCLRRVTLRLSSAPPSIGAARACEQVRLPFQGQRVRRNVLGHRCVEAPVGVVRRAGLTPIGTLCCCNRLHRRGQRPTPNNSLLSGEIDWLLSPSSPVGGMLTPAACRPKP